MQTRKVRLKGTKQNKHTKILACFFFIKLHVCCRVYGLTVTAGLCMYGSGPAFPRATHTSQEIKGNATCGLAMTGLVLL